MRTLFQRNIFCLFFYDTNEKFFGAPVKIVRKRLSKLFQRVLRKKMIVSSVICYCNIFLDWEEKVSDLSPYTFLPVGETAFYLSRATFWATSGERTLKFQRVFFPIFKSLAVRQGCENCFRCVKLINWGKLVISKKSKSDKFCCTKIFSTGLGIVLKFRPEETIQEKTSVPWTTGLFVLSFWNKDVVGLAELRSTCPEESLDSKRLLKKIWF